jgi:16S rRNA (guanine(966)-N(2))-methyltransferase RsmD
MRVIAGAFKGRKLESPADRQVRPTTDKVKEAIFSMLQGVVPDAVCADLFTGCGALGLEALSRGAKRVYFCDLAKSSRSLARRNAAHCGVSEEEAVFLLGPWERALERIPEPVDLVFLDPP